MNDMPEIGGRKPSPIDVDAGQSYRWRYVRACCSVDGFAQLRRVFCSSSHMR